MPIRPFYYPERSPLLQQLLGANLAQSGGPQSAVGSIASVLAAILAAKGIGDSNQARTAQAAKLADVLSKQLAPNQQVSTSLEGVGGIPDQISSVTRMNPQQPDLKTALMGMEPQALQGLQTQLIAQQFGGTAPEKFASSPGGIYSERTGKITTSFPEKPPNTPDFEQQMTDLWGPMKDWTPEQRAKYEDSLLKKGTPPISPETPLQSDMPSLRDLHTVRVNTQNLLGATQRLREQLAADPAMGLAGVLTRGGNTIAEQSRQLARIADTSDFAEVKDPSLYKDVFDKFSWLTEDARKSAAVRSNIIRLAYLQAKSMDLQGRVAKDDMQYSMEALAGSGGSATQLLGNIGEMEASARTNAMNQYADIKGSPMPEHWLDLTPSPAPNAHVPSGLGPAVGTVENGYRFKGGDPADYHNWEKVQ